MRTDDMSSTQLRALADQVEQQEQREMLDLSAHASQLDTAGRQIQRDVAIHFDPVVKIKPSALRMRII